MILATLAMVSWETWAVLAISRRVSMAGGGV